jgi:NitT/TauT family transport system permease protein
MMNALNLEGCFRWRGRMYRTKSILTSLLLGFISYLIFWQLLFLILNTHTVPAPIETLAYTGTIFFELLTHCGASILRVGVAISISLLIGIPLGVLLSVNKICKRIFSPFLYFIYPIPKVAFLPVFMLLFGLGNTSKVILVIWIIVFQIILSVRDGVEQILPIYFKVMDSFCVTKGQRYRYLILPAIIPSIFSGLRISIGISMASLFFAENYAAKYGIGYFILSAWTKMDYVEMFSGILAMGFVGIVLFLLLDYLETIVTPFKK